MPVSPTQVLNIRLKNEYDEIMKLPANKFYKVEPAPGQRAPYVKRYRVTYTIPTYVKNGTRMQNETRVEIELPESFPVGAPTMRVIGGDVPFHVNWWSNGTLCNGNFWNPNRWLYDYINFAAEVLSFREERVNIYSPANHDAIPFFTNNKSRFPTVSGTLPVPRASKYFRIIK